MYALGCAKASPKRELKSVGFLTGLGPAEQAFVGVRLGHRFWRRAAFWAPATMRRVIDRSLVRRAQDEANLGVYHDYITQAWKRAEAHKRKFVDERPDEEDLLVEMTRAHFIQGSRSYMREIVLQIEPAGVKLPDIDYPSFKIWLGGKNMDRAVRSIENMTKELEKATIRKFEEDDHFTLLPNRAEDILRDLLRD